MYIVSSANLNHGKTSRPLLRQTYMYMYIIYMYMYVIQKAKPREHACPQTPFQLVLYPEVCNIESLEWAWELG